MTKQCNFMIMQWRFFFSKETWFCLVSFCTKNVNSSAESTIEKSWWTGTEIKFLCNGREKWKAVIFGFPELLRSSFSLFSLRIERVCGLLQFNIWFACVGFELVENIDRTNRLRTRLVQYRVVKQGWAVSIFACLPNSTFRTELELKMNMFSTTNESFKEN